MEEEEEKGVGRIEKTTTAMNEMDNRTMGVKKSRGKQEQRPTHRSVPTLSPPSSHIHKMGASSICPGGERTRVGIERCTSAVCPTLMYERYISAEREAEEEFVMLHGNVPRVCTSA